MTMRLSQDILDPEFTPGEWDAGDERAAILWDGLMDLADHVRALKAELRRLAGPFCERCRRPLSDDDIAAYGSICESCERALARRHGV
jgi:hypothetical protein